MLRRWLIRLCLLLPAVAISLTGCTANNEVVPIPHSAKYVEPDQAIIPFPYTDRFSNGEERWFVDRDTSNHLVLRVTWRDKEVAAFPIDGIGVNPATGRLTLGDREYSAVSITLNHDDLPHASGWIVLQEEQPDIEVKTLR